eukprot:CAMPEP_0119148268 /NCGR_PEP_ID=MMETSP1310-20130426/41570_1 /TAXON_ID=464262 /ORGANISM="Genus nov. species nov., Strain RCC2339" /LENGTH=71 /DNA_ID=CAMNT_0007140293 /DNA_START=45 /DNA_END=260 /DNA_ORIENTATION=-
MNRGAMVTTLVRRKRPLPSWTDRPTLYTRPVASHATWRSPVVPGDSRLTGRDHLEDATRNSALLPKRSRDL